MGSGRRRSLRRRVAIECVVHSDYWDGGVTLAASDVSDEGLWIDTGLILDEGEPLILSFEPPGCPRTDIWVAAEVARVGLARRRSDTSPTGMGLSFTYLSERDRSLLAHSLVGHPPRLPWVRRRPPPLPRRTTTPRPAWSARATSSRDDAVPAVLDADLAGSFRFASLGAMLCSPRGHGRAIAQAQRA